MVRAFDVCAGEDVLCAFQDENTIREHSLHFILKSFEVDVLVHCDFGLPYLEGFHGRCGAVP